MSDLSLEIKQSAILTEIRFKDYFKEYSDSYQNLVDSMRYSFEAGGKRIRPFLTLGFCRLFNGNESNALDFACAMEMMHTSSLIHDDLPCMDDDDLRRGLPTNHKKFGEATALLAGDALILLSFNALSSATVSPEYIVKAVNLLSECAGYRGMVGGQVIDLESEGKGISYDTLCELQSLKTGRLIRAACLLGCFAAQTDDKEIIDNVTFYADSVGRAFQIIDDILDITSNEETMGKSLSDADNNKTTFLSFMSLDEARGEAERLTNRAVKALSGYKNSEILTEFAVYLLNRKK